MEQLINVLGTGFEIIIGFLKEYPLAGALCTVLALVGYLLLRKIYPDRVALNAIIVIMCWLTVVPILNCVLTGTGWLFEFVAFTWKIGVFTCRVYIAHPIMAVAIALMLTATYFVGKKKWSSMIRNRKLRIGAFVVIYVMAIGLAAPWANLFFPPTPIESIGKGDSPQGKGTEVPPRSNSSNSQSPRLVEGGLDSQKAKGTPMAGSDNAQSKK